MSVEAISTASLATSDRKIIHPAWVRVTHWINAVAMILMILSGWQIYNASPLFPFEFPIGPRRLAGRRACSGTSPRCGCS